MEEYQTGHKHVFGDILVKKEKKSCYNCLTKFEFPNQVLRIGKWIIYGKWKKLLPSLNLQNVGLVKGFCFNFEILVPNKRPYKALLFLGIGFGRGVKTTTWELGIGSRCQSKHKLVGVDWENVDDNGCIM